jgi:hypothetical protein
MASSKFIHEIKVKTAQAKAQNPILHFKSIEVKAKELGFKLDKQMLFEGNYTLSNRYMKVNFTRLYEIIEFLNWAKGEPKKRFIKVA